MKLTELSRAWRSAWLFAFLLVAYLVPTAPIAAQEVNHAGVVVRHGDGRLTYAYVAFDEESISGAELLERTGIPLVTVSFGGLGQGVCSIDREGCSAGECRRRVCQGPGDDSPFWQYFRQEAPGEWRPLTLGASSTKVHDGDVDGWSWTPKDPRLPEVTIADVARLAGVADDSANLPAGDLPTAAVSDVYPSGVVPEAQADDQDPIVYLGAGAVLLGIGVAALFAVRRSHTGGGSA